MTNTITHWMNNKAFAGASSATAPVTNPATGEVTGEVALGSVEDARAVIDAAAAAFPAWRDTSLAKRTQILFAFRELLNEPQGRAGRDHHHRARQGRLRRARRGQPRPGSRRVRLRYPASAQGRVHRERLDQGRRLLDPPAARPGRRHQPVQLPGHGADVVLPHRHRRRQHRGAQAVREGSDRRAVDGRAVGGGRPARRRVQRAAGRQDRRRRTADQPQAIKSISFVGSTPIAQYVYATGTAARQARPGPRRRQEPRRDPARRRPRPGRRRDGQRRLRLGRRALHGDLGLRRGRPHRRRPGRQDHRAHHPAEDRRRHQGFRHGPAGHQGAPRQGGLLHRRRRGRRRQDRRRRPHRRRPTAAPRASGWAPP